MKQGIDMYKVRCLHGLFQVQLFNATFNNIVISWRSDLLMEETGENHQPVASHLENSKRMTLYGIGERAKQIYTNKWSVFNY